MMQSLPRADIAELTALRHALHRHPDLSGSEGATAERITADLRALGADRICQGLGGHGVAAEFWGREAGPTVLLRCELDGLPIRETSDLPYCSAIEARGHLCGHDGHMVTLLGVARLLARRPARGRVILLFQPAEETGAGAAAVIADPRWPDLRPDFAFAWHNVPGRPLGQIGLRPGPGNCASRGMQVRLHGRSSHAAAPEDGLSPGAAMAGLMVALPGLSQSAIGEADYALATLTHARLGAPTFGIAPADGDLRVTLRTMTNARMDTLIAQAQALLEAARGDLAVEVHWHDVFRAVVNDAAATALARDAALAGRHDVAELDRPLRWSEDFGRIGEDGAQAALLYVGAGEDHPQLHAPDYDFPDALIPIVADLLIGIVERLLGRAPA
jgi:amidohydrolase